MDALQITTNEKRIPIVRDGTHVGELVFNPSDVIFAEKFYRLIGEFQQQLTWYQSKSLELDKSTTLDASGMPNNMDERLKLVQDACLFMRAKIDSLFGENTSQMVFGDSYELQAFEQFFTGITPFIQSARADKVQKYTRGKK